MGSKHDEAHEDAASQATAMDERSRWRATGVCRVPSSSTVPTTVPVPLSTAATRCEFSSTTRCCAMKRFCPCSENQSAMTLIEPATKTTPRQAKKIVKMRSPCDSVGLSP